MEKASIAICMTDQSYQKRFVKCLLNHFKEQYEIHSFTDVGELDFNDEARYAVVITDREESKEQLCFKICPDKPTILVDKYQAVYKIMEIISANLEERYFKPAACKDRTVEKIGVFSLENPSLQLPYCAMLSNIYGEDKKTLLINLMPHLGEFEANEDGFCLEDLMMIVTKGQYAPSRVLSGIGHCSKWDYIYPVKNAEILAEGSQKIYEDLIELLVKEHGYEVVIINFGSVFAGMFDFMESCSKVHLIEMSPQTKWRQKAFEVDLERRGKSEFFHRILKIKIPAITSYREDWERLAQKWEWSQLGDYIRSIR